MTEEKDDDVFNDAKDTAQVGETMKEPEAEAPKGEEAETPAAEDEKSVIPVAALKSERQKRQAAERERDELKQRLSGDKEEPELSEIIFNERTNMSREIMLELKDDYEDMESLFIELAKEDNSLIEKMKKSPNPAKYAYNAAKEHLEIEELRKTKESEDWKAFQEWKKEQSKKPPEETPQTRRNKAALSVPDLTKATAAKPKDGDKEDDNVFRGAHF